MNIDDDQFEKVQKAIDRVEKVKNATLEQKQKSLSSLNQIISDSSAFSKFLNFLVISFLKSSF